MKDFHVFSNGEYLGVARLPEKTTPLYQMTASVTIKPSAEVVSIWDTRSWIAPEKSVNKR